MKLFQTLDLTEWSDNKEYIFDDFVLNFILTDNLNEEEFSKKMLKNKNFTNGFLRLFKKSFRRFINDENIEKYPVFFFYLIILEGLLNCKHFQDLCLENRMIEFFFSYIIFHENFPVSCLIDDNIEIPIFVYSLTVKRYMIYSYSLSLIYTLILRKGTLFNNQIKNEILKKLPELSENLWNGIVYEIFAKMLVILFYTGKDFREKRNLLTLDLLTMVFNKLDEFQQQTFNDQLENSYSIDTSFYIFKLLFEYQIHIGELISKRNEFLKFLEMFHSDFTETILEIIINLINTRFYYKNIPENDEFYFKLKKLNINHFQKNHHLTVNKIICMIHDISIKKYKDILYNLANRGLPRKSGKVNIYINYINISNLFFLMCILTVFLKLN